MSAKVSYYFCAGSLLLKTMEVSEGSQMESVSQKGPLPSSMMWVKQLRNYVGSGEGLGSEQLTGLSFDQCHFFSFD